MTNRQEPCDDFLGPDTQAECIPAHFFHWHEYSVDDDDVIYLLTYLLIVVLWMLQKSTDDQRYRGGSNVAQSHNRLPLLGSFHTTEAYVFFTLSHGRI